MKNQGVTEEIPTKNEPDNDRINEAAQWLHDNRSTCADRLIPALKERFGLRNIEAIEAAKIARGLDYARSL
ncbi:hypothetical protein QD336_19410 [Rhizobium sp. BR 250]